MRFVENPPIGSIAKLTVEGAAQVVIVLLAKSVRAQNV
jgi:hypothetical protein